MVYSMETPICLSQYFVNKQNVRSYGNMVKKSLDDLFLKHLFTPEDYLANCLTDEFVLLLFIMKTNTEVRSNNDFKEVFSKEDDTFLKTVNKELIFEHSWKVINEIVPKKIIGGNHNEKILRSFIQSIIYSMKRQHIVLIKFLDKWDFTTSLWQNINGESKKILYYILLWIVKNILSLMICLNFYVTTCKLDADEYKLHYFWKSQWQSFYDKKISEMMFTKVLKKCEPLCLGKKMKHNHSTAERLKLKSLKRDIPKLHLILKPNNEYRPIVRYRMDSQNPSEKYKIRERTKFLKILTATSHIKIEIEYISIYKKWLASDKPKLYFIKTDLSNAFGTVDKEKLLKILCDRHMNFQKLEHNITLKKKIAQQYKEIITELRRPLLVRAGSTIFEWQNGLVQGYKYSPALSELYYNYIDDLYLSDLMKKCETQIKLFVRVVDDYLYITESLDDAHAFLNALSNYRNINYRKTVVNFEHSYIQFSKEMTFLGYSYNTENMEVSRSINVLVGQMCYKIAFSSAISNMQMFIENRIGQSGIQINSHIFNFFHNSEELIWKHVFTTFCLSANKFCTILAILCDEKQMQNYLVMYKKRVVVKLTNSILDTLLKNKTKNHQFVYCINHFRYISWKALYLCAKETPKCSSLIPYINNELKKTNCLFGKWNKHASKIHSNGELSEVAVKEVCRRSDLRAIVKIFDCLPEGFECYNHRNYRKIVNKIK